jgi:hypothetical protein
MKAAHQKIDAPAKPKSPKPSLSKEHLSDAAYIGALTAGIVVASAGVAATGPLIPVSLGVVAAVGFSISYMIQWMKTLKVNDEFIRLLDYMYAHARYISKIEKAHPNTPYLQHVVVRVAAIIRTLKESPFNKKPETLLEKKPSMTERFSSVLRTARKATNGKLWVTAQDVAALQMLITTSAHEIEFLMTGVILFVEATGLKLDKIDFDFKVTAPMPNLEAYDPKTLDLTQIQPESAFVGGRRRKSRKRR